MGKRGMGTVYLRGRTWWIAYWRNGEQFHESSKSDDHDKAQDLLKVRLGEIVTGKFAGLEPQRATVDDLLGLVIQDYIVNGRHSLEDVQIRIKAQIRPAFGKLRVVDLSTGHVMKFQNRRRGEGVSNATINRELAILRRGLQLGLQQEPPVVLRAIHIPKLKENNVRQGFVSAAQYKRLLKELPERLKLLLVIGYHTGIRKGEALRIRVDQIDLKRDQIRLNAGETKNDEGRVLPIYGEMRTLLAAAIKKRHAEAKRTGEFPPPWLFHEDGQPIRSFFKAWRSACKRAGVPGQLFHDLRRSAVRNMERAGISRSVAMKISGHKTEGVYRRYAIVNEQDIADAGRKLEKGTVTKTVTIRRRKAQRAS